MLRECSNDAIQKALLSGGIDLAIAAYPKVPPSIELADYYTEHTVLCLVDSLLVQCQIDLDVRRNEIAAGDLHSLRDCPFVLGSAADIGGRIGRELLRASGISPISKATSENVETLLALCVQGVGACFCPENLLQTALSPEQLAQLHILPLCPSASYPICFGYLRRSYPWSVLSEFIRIAREQIRSA